MASEVRVGFKRVISPQAGPHKAVSRFFWTVIGDEVQLDFGHPDLSEMREAIKRIAAGEDPEKCLVPVSISDRFLLTPGSAAGLLRCLEAIVNHLRKNNLLPKEENAN